MAEQTTERLERAKFEVRRTNPEAQARHPLCRHFVLDLDHDPHALPALHAYALAAAGEHPELAEDIHTLLGQVRPTLGVSGEH